MKHLLFVILFSACCNQSNTAREYPVVTKYKVNRNPSNLYHQEYDTLNVKKIVKNNDVTYIYSIEVFEGNRLFTVFDTLSISRKNTWYKDNVGSRSITKFCAEKEFLVRGKKILIKKYAHSSHRRLSNIFFNDSTGLIADKFLSHPSDNEIARLYNSDLQELHNAINSDSLFFKFELPF